MPRLRGEGGGARCPGYEVEAAGQDAPATRLRRRGKMPRLRGGGGGARCPGYEVEWAGTRPAPTNFVVEAMERKAAKQSTPHLCSRYPEHRRDLANTDHVSLCLLVLPRETDRMHDDCYNATVGQYHGLWAVHYAVDAAK